MNVAGGPPPKGSPWPPKPGPAPKGAQPPRLRRWRRRFEWWAARMVVAMVSTGAYRPAPPPIRSTPLPMRRQRGR